MNRINQSIKQKLLSHEETVLARLPWAFSARRLFPRYRTSLEILLIHTIAVVSPRLTDSISEDVEFIFWLIHSHPFKTTREWMNLVNGSKCTVHVSSPFDTTNQNSFWTKELARYRGRSLWDLLLPEKWVFGKYRQMSLCVKPPTGGE